jgi:hypothetical protein
VFKKLIQSYNEFHVDEIQTNRFQPERYNEVIDQLSSKVEIKNLGKSILGRPIRQFRLGSGPLRVLMWSQMHGNESTASRAILDLLNFNNDPGEFKAEWQEILDKLTIYLIPIVNPDGTAEFKRRNAIHLDLNRDARAAVCPESIILQEAMQRIKPDFSFNLHDQRRFYNITGTARPSTVSFLAPAYDFSEAVNATRLAAMQLIAAMRNNLETVIPGQVGLYDDDFAPRAFGDYSQASGAATILVEAGWQQYDMEKEFVRKLNFALFAAALSHIAMGSYSTYQESDYRSIPMNDEKLFDVLIRGAMLVNNDQRFSVDLGIQREEETPGGSDNYYSVGLLSDLGDLREWHGFEEVEAGDLLVTKGTVADISLAEWQNLKETEQIDLIKSGNLFLTADKPGIAKQPSGEIINIIHKEIPLPMLEFEQPANFLLINRGGEIKYIILNGFLWPVDEASPEGLNGLIIN